MIDSASALCGLDACEMTAACQAREPCSYASESDVCCSTCAAAKDAGFRARRPATDDQNLLDPHTWRPVNVARKSDGLEPTP